MDKGNLVKIIHPERDINTPLDKVIEKTVKALDSSDIIKKALISYYVERNLWSATTFKDVLQYLT